MTHDRTHGVSQELKEHLQGFIENVHFLKHLSTEILLPLKGTVARVVRPLFMIRNLSGSDKQTEVFLFEFTFDFDETFDHKDHKQIVGLVNRHFLYLKSFLS